MWGFHGHLLTLLFRPDWFLDPAGSMGVQDLFLLPQLMVSFPPQASVIWPPPSGLAYVNHELSSVYY